MDYVFERFLQSCAAEAERLEARSDILQVLPFAPYPASSYLISFDTPYLARTPAATARVKQGPVKFGIHFVPDYLHCPDRGLYMRVACLLSPDFVHPNVRFPFVCLGSAFAPGTRLSLLIRELHQIATYQNLSLLEANSLDPTAGRLLRARPDLIQQLPKAPLIRRDSRPAIEVKGL